MRHHIVFVLLVVPGGERVGAGEAIAATGF